MDEAIQDTGRVAGPGSLGAILQNYQRMYDFLFKRDIATSTDAS